MSSDPTARFFLAAFSRCGLSSFLLTQKLKRENQVLVAARDQLHRGEIQPPAIHPSVPQNMLHVVTAGGLNVLGFRMPTSTEFAAKFRRPTWGWLIQAAASLRTRPSGAPCIRRRFEVPSPRFAGLGTRYQVRSAGR